MILKRTLKKRRLKNNYENKVEVICEWCKGNFLRNKGSVKDNNFCCQRCLHKWNGERQRINMDSQIDKMIELYNDGLSLNDLSKKFGYGRTTIRSRLLEKGITFRIGPKTGKGNSRYKKGFYINKGGYVVKSIHEYPKEHHDILNPMKHTNNCNLLEHRAEMAIHLGRTLKKEEIVHHINGIKTENRISNLQIVTLSNHRGEIKCPFCNKVFAIK